MTRYLIPILLCLTTLGSARAEPIRVMTDIAPVHSLVSMVMKGIGTPDALLPPGASPHDFALRPSDARKLSRADAVFWMGTDFTPWLGRALEALAPDAPSLQFIDVPGTLTLPYRENAIFGAKEEHSGEEDHLAHDEGGHGGHDKDGSHASGSSAKAEKVGIAVHNHHGHAHAGGLDLHAWQNPENAKTWLDAIADTLGQIDPENITTYRANALVAKQDIDTIATELEETVRPVRGRNFVVTHDAYHYFEHRFEIEALAAILPSDGSPASAKRVQAISRELSEAVGVCIFVEPQMSDSLARSLADQIDAKVATLDPIGDSLQRGPELYLGLMRGIGDSLADCLS
ncbi:MAG: zinc ABC transporter substrate-binding protein [Pseudomonadota bacterium]